MPECGQIACTISKRRAAEESDHRHETGIGTSVAEIGSAAAISYRRALSPLLEPNGRHVRHQNLKEISKEIQDGLQVGFKPDTSYAVRHSRVTCWRSKPPSFASSEEDDCELSSVRTNTPRYPVRFDHQGSDEGRRCRSTPACSNAEGGGTKVGRSSRPSSADITNRLNK